MILAALFLIAISIRFLFFPNNIYFGYDQARDAFAAIDLLKGDLKIVGPTTTFEGLNHGVLYWYILSPFYLISKNPEIASFGLRVLNALGVFLIFFIGKNLFGKRVGLIAALLFATSFEQSQFAIYMGNPTLGSLSVPLMYLGLILVIFAKKAWGLSLAFLGLGMSIQFQFALIYLTIPFLLILILFKEHFLKIPLKIWFISLICGCLAISTFLLAEVKYNFRATQALFLLIGSGNQKDLANILGTYFYTISKILEFNLINNLPITIFMALVLLILFLLFLKKNQKQFIVLGIWFFSLIITFMVNGGVSNPKVSIPLYYPNVGVSVAFLLFTAFLLNQLYLRNKFCAFSLLFVISILNIYQITLQNPKGTILEINSQPGMLLSDEKKALDFIYQDANGQFAVKALSMPLNINTTWSYLFEFYGQPKYDYLPIWNGKTALGFPGNLKVQEAQERLPDKRYVIIEPLRGIPDYLVNDFFTEEGYFTKLEVEKDFGELKLQKRSKI